MSCFRSLIRATATGSSVFTTSSPGKHLPLTLKYFELSVYNSIRPLTFYGSYYSTVTSPTQGDYNSDNRLGYMKFPFVNVLERNETFKRTDDVPYRMQSRYFSSGVNGQTSLGHEKQNAEQDPSAEEEPEENPQTSQWGFPIPKLLFKEYEDHSVNSGKNLLAAIEKHFPELFPEVPAYHARSQTTRLLEGLESSYRNVAEAWTSDDLKQIKYAFEPNLLTVLGRFRSLYVKVPTVKVESVDFRVLYMKVPLIDSLADILHTFLMAVIGGRTQMIVKVLITATEVHTGPYVCVPSKEPQSPQNRGMKVDAPSEDDDPSSSPSQALSSERIFVSYLFPASTRQTSQEGGDKKVYGSYQPQRKLVKQIWTLETTVNAREMLHYLAETDAHPVHNDEHLASWRLLDINYLIDHFQGRKTGRFTKY